ncbi:toll/interleukin-1 receptor domain-containing protein [Streptomyces sp. NPDC057280]|uniref:toll/interleukin-1 receptor domain-containing protein n=1 Tax=Streptomyces sp. NPDC057280 TaxID=3346081 RepID=UPI00363AA8E3
MRNRGFGGAMSAVEGRDQASDGVWFVSHAGADRAWAEWIAWQLLDAGHEVELDCWDWGTGDNFILKMNAALEQGRMVALFSPAYFGASIAVHSGVVNRSGSAPSSVAAAGAQTVCLKAVEFADLEARAPGPIR